MIILRHILFLFFSSNLCFAATTLDRIAAVVNQHVISAQELARETDNIREDLKRQSQTLPRQALLQQQVLDHMIMTTLQEQRAQQLNLNVEPIEIQHALEVIAKKNRTSVAKVKQGALMPYPALRQRLRTQLLIQHVQQRDVADKIVISDAEINAFLRHSPHFARQHQYHLRNILISLGEQPTPTEVEAAKRRAQALLVTLQQQPQSFSTAALQQSKDHNALSGGDLGWRRTHELPEIFAKEVTSMRQNEIRGPLRAANGYHLIQLVAQQSGPKSYITQTRARHLLLKNRHDDESAQEQIHNLRQHILKGQSFAKLARLYSEDRRTAAQGGNLGWVNPGTLPANLDHALQTLSKGSVSIPIKTTTGWHLLYVTGRRKHDNTRIAMRQRARQALFQKKFAEDLKTWLEQLKRDAFIKTMAL